MENIGNDELFIKFLNEIDILDRHTQTHTYLATL